MQQRALALLACALLEQVGLAEHARLAEHASDSGHLFVDAGSFRLKWERHNEFSSYTFFRHIEAGDADEDNALLKLPPAWRKQLPSNKGLEALMVVPKNLPLAGTLIALSERGLDADGNIIAFLIGGKTPGQFSLRRTDKFEVSDGVLLPSGDLLVLERKFSWLSGIGIRIRRIPLKSVGPGALVDGPAIFEADLGHEVDNMEAIDVHVTPEGDTVLTLVSDDNFSMIQRNLLMQFTLVE